MGRFARSMTPLIETVEGLGRRDIGFESVTESLDTSTITGGKLIFHLFASLAEFERAVRRERIRAGLIAARAQGCTGERPRTLSESDLAAAKALLKDSGITVEEIARRLKVAPSTLYRALPVSAGYHF